MTAFTFLRAHYCSLFKYMDIYRFYLKRINCRRNVVKLRRKFVGGGGHSGEIE